MEGLEHNVALEELYLSHNGIEHLENFAHLVRIQVLTRSQYGCDFVYVYG